VAKDPSGAAIARGGMAQASDLRDLIYVTDDRAVIGDRLRPLIDCKRQFAVSGDHSSARTRVRMAGDRAMRRGPASAWLVIVVFGEDLRPRCR
jgi:hypothetical protein